MAPAAHKYRRVAAAAAIFFLVAPGPVAALVWISDFAPVAEFTFLLLTYILWAEIEKTPLDWKGFPNLSDSDQRRWLLKWTGLSAAVYLGYKTKADVKLIPVIAGAFIALTRRLQWRLFAAPICLMLMLAVPWNSGLFRKLPPFVPGSAGSSESFMWQPASISRVADFIWSSNPFSLHEGSLSLAGLLGPFLLSGAAALVIWKLAATGPVRLTLQTPSSRARLFVLIWFAAILAAASALPPIPYYFRIRYGILTLAPVSILLAALVAWSGDFPSRLRPWAITAGLVLFSLQTFVNLDRSVRYRRQLGQVEVAVDQAYAYVTRNYPNDDLALMPDFLPYDYRLDACPAIKRRYRIAGVEELAARHASNRTMVLSWQPRDGPLQRVAQFNGCRSSTLFDRLAPCMPGSGIYMMRYAGSDSGAYSAQEYLSRSYEFCRAQQPRECIAMAKLALNLLPSCAEAYNNIAAAYEDLGMWDEAIQAAREALRLKPDFQLAKNNLAWSESQKALQQRGARTK